MKCTQPGCSGTIADGYCNVCGMPPTVAPATSNAGPATALSPDDGEATQRAPAGPAVSAPVAGTAPAADSEADAEVDSRSLSSKRLGSTAVGSRRTGSTSTRRVRTGSQRVRSARLGAGLTTIPPTETTDPAAAINPDPSVPERKRNCAKCGTPVGRTLHGRPGRPEGFCSKCGAPYSFTPKLLKGDLVAGQYHVEGALAHGGLGWIYLARDRNVSDRWVVLKGLLNSGDPDALAAAIAEQRFLAQVEYPSIVQIYNFVTHEGAGYIVMEYVGGPSLKQILKERMDANGGAYDPLPVDQALAYIIEVLPAFRHLHDMGLVYCDFKPDNLIQVGDAIKLIDLGGVRRVDDLDSAIYGTVGYQAPEVATMGVSVESDIYTIGRTLLVLCHEFRGYQTTYEHSLPDPAEVPVFRDHDSLYWLVAKCCAPNPDDRFASADELRTQALGVLREVVADEAGVPAQTTVASVHFTSPLVTTWRIDWFELPTLRPDPGDPQYPWLTGLATGTPTARLKALSAAPEDTAEVWLARGSEYLLQGSPDDAIKTANALLTKDPWEWRALWLAGLAHIQKKDWQKAMETFNAVYQQVPGELAPKLALAVACEATGQSEIAENLYRTCALTDGAYLAPAAFGLSRLRAARGDTDGAVAALDSVPTTSSGYLDSRRLRAQLLSEGNAQDLSRLDQALKSIEGVDFPPAEREELTVRILEQALRVVTKSGPKPVQIGPYKAAEPDLRDGLESSFRRLAREADSDDDRITRVNQANTVREWTLR